MTEFMNLWGFAKKISPLRCAAYERWFDITAETLESKSPATARVAKTEILYKYGSRPDWEIWPMELDLLKNKANNLRSRAKYIMSFYLPDLIRKTLLSGAYKITAVQGEKRVEITPEDLVGLEINIPRGVLYSETAVFDRVAISVRETLPPEAGPPPDQPTETGAGDDTGTSGPSLMVAVSDQANAPLPDVEEEFHAWMLSEKVAWGKWPGEHRNEKTGQPGWRDFRPSEGRLTMARRREFVQAKGMKNRPTP